jgi:hypothetical protein
MMIMKTMKIDPCRICCTLIRVIFASRLDHHTLEVHEVQTCWGFLTLLLRSSHATMRITSTSLPKQCCLLGRLLNDLE